MMQTLLLLVNEWPIISWSVMIIYLIIALLVYCTVVVISLLFREARRSKNSYHHCIIQTPNASTLVPTWQDFRSQLFPVLHRVTILLSKLKTWDTWPWLFCYLRIHCVKPKRYKETWSSQRVWTMDSIHLGSNPTMLAWVVWYASTSAHPGASKAVSFTSPKSAQTSAPMV